MDYRSLTYATIHKSLIVCVYTEIWSKLIKARRFKNTYPDTVEYKLAQFSLHECFGMIKTLLILELISKDEYKYLYKAIETYDLSIIETYLYKGLIHQG